MCEILIRTENTLEVCTVFDLTPLCLYTKYLSKIIYLLLEFTVKHLMTVLLAELAEVVIVMSHQIIEDYLLYVVRYLHFFYPNHYVIKTCFSVVNLVICYIKKLHLILN